MNTTFDVVVLGSGAAGLTAAIAAAEEGARVAIVEKADQIGGTSAWSGGHVWIPDNPHMAAVGATDSPTQALTYIMSLSRGLIDEGLMRSYIAAGPEMVRFLDARAGTDFYAVSDPTCKGQVRATLGPLDEGPFYALPVKSGSLGTKGGPQVDVDGRVIDLDGEPIVGLYAAGNVMASSFGMTYGGAGGTLGPAMVYGFLAGRHAAAMTAAG